MKFLIPIFAGTILLVLGGCSENGPTQREQVTAVLTSKTWSLKSVTVDGADNTNVYDGLSLSFTKTGFSATQGEPVWPASGTWSFTDGDAKVMTRDDGLDIQITEATKTALKLSFGWSKTTIGGGRNSSVSGQHVFIFQ